MEELKKVKLFRHTYVITFGPFKGDIFQSNWSTKHESRGMGYREIKVEEKEVIIEHSN